MPRCRLVVDQCEEGPSWARISEEGSMQDIAPCCDGGLAVEVWARGVRAWFSPLFLVAEEGRGVSL